VPHAPLVIVNPAAGGGRARRLVPWLQERMGSFDAGRLTITWRAGEAEELAAGARIAGHDRVVAVGGDGTVQEIVNGLLAEPEPIELGLMPVGTGNDLARSLGLPGRYDAAWAIATGPRTRAIDVARGRNGAGGSRWFASAGGAGFDAQVAAAMATRRGLRASRAGYLLTTLSELRRFENRRVEVTIDGQTFEREVLFVAFANGEYYGGGMHICPGAQPDDGRLDVCVVGDISRRTALRQLPNIYRGTHLRHPAVSMYAGAALRIDGDGATRIHLDGEPFGSLPLEVTLRNAAVRVAAPAAHGDRQS
jgi:diacylglycerol kinase (ATP)